MVNDQPTRLYTCPQIQTLAFVTTVWIITSVLEHSAFTCLLLVGWRHQKYFSVMWGWSASVSDNVMTTAECFLLVDYPKFLLDMNTSCDVISGFRRDVDDICALPGYYEALSDSYVPTFRDNLCLLQRSRSPSWTFWPPTQQSADLTSCEVWSCNVLLLVNSPSPSSGVF
jgi:hypothetical protein